MNKALAYTFLQNTHTTIITLCIKNAPDNKVENIKLSTNVIRADSSKATGIAHKQCGHYSSKYGIRPWKEYSNPNSTSEDTVGKTFCCDEKMHNEETGNAFQDILTSSPAPLL